VPYSSLLSAVALSMLSVAKGATLVSVGSPKIEKATVWLGLML